MDDRDYARGPGESREVWVDRLLAEMRAEHSDWEEYTDDEKRRLENQVHLEIFRHRLLTGDLPSHWKTRSLGKTAIDDDRIGDHCRPIANMRIDQAMSPDEMQASGISLLTDEQRDVLLGWGMRMYQLGQHIVATIEEVKYDGRLIILDDGSRWEVNSYDSTTADMWGPLERVVVIDDMMYKLDESEMVSVTQEFL